MGIKQSEYFENKNTMSTHIPDTQNQKTINHKKIADSAFKTALQENLMKRKKATKIRIDNNKKI